MPRVDVWYSDISVLSPEFLNLVNKHATYLPATHAETCVSSLTCSLSMYPQNNQNLSVYLQNTTRIQSISFLILSSFAASDILSIYLKFLSENQPI